MKIIDKELNELKKLYPKLSHKILNGIIFLEGEISFCLIDPNTGKPPISDKYQIEIKIRSDFPMSLPIVMEIGQKIERSYEHISDESVLCLGIPSELYLLLNKKPTIQGFIENILEPNLYAYSFYKKYGYMPWKDRLPGQLGIVCRYMELFNTIDLETILKLLEIVIKGDYRVNSKCPCGNAKTLNECHGEKIFFIWQIPWNYIYVDYEALRDFKNYFENFIYSKFQKI